MKIPKLRQGSFFASLRSSRAGGSLWRCTLRENRELHASPDPHCLYGNKAAKPTRTWFALNGCKRCRKAG